ncbi:MAG: hypothetical protein ACOC45_05990 [Alkalispirochaetaceae bacterium]
MTTTLSQTVATILPILLIIGLGVIIRLSGLLGEESIDALKQLIVKVALPAVLFRSFLGISFSSDYIVIFILVPAVCFFLLAIGYLLRRLLPVDSRYTPYLSTGFEFGMVGITLYSAAYGIENAGVIGVVGLTHELFIWFVFVTLLRGEAMETGKLSETLRSFITSPVILAIFAGVFFNLLGLGGWMEEALLPASLLRTLGYLGDLIIPLILIIIGFGIRLSVRGAREASLLVLVRFALVLTLALVINRVYLRELGPLVEAAFFTFLILPPPYIVPLFIPKERSGEIAYANNVLSLYTLLSVAAFIVYVSVNSPA